MANDSLTSKEQLQLGPELQKIYTRLWIDCEAVLTGHEAAVLAAAVRKLNGLSDEPSAGVKCTHCNGKGYNEPIYDEQDGWIDETPCETCNGSGRITTVEQYLKTLPANWHEDSSLETWFPITAEELKRLKDERASQPPAAIPPSTQSKSDAQIAAELQTNMDAMIEPTDERERQCYRRLIRIMARARNRLQQIADAQSTAEPPSALQGDALYQKKQNECQAIWRTNMTLVCSLPKGHDGDHRDACGYTFTGEVDIRQAVTKDAAQPMHGGALVAPGRCDNGECWCHGGISAETKGGQS